MQPERDRAARHPFVAAIEVTELESESRLLAYTGDLGLSGCSVKTTTPFDAGKRVRLRITHGDISFNALGRVIYSQQDVGMGVVFTQVEPGDQAVLLKWLSQLASSAAGAL